MSGNTRDSGEEGIRRLFDMISGRGGGEEEDCDACGACGGHGSSKNTPEVLREAYETYNKKYEFKPGMFVRWKKNMRCKAIPAEGEPAIVLEVLSAPVIDEENGAGSPYFREPLDVILGSMGHDGELLRLYHDSRRFEPYE